MVQTKIKQYEPIQTRDKIKLSNDMKTAFTLRHNDILQIDLASGDIIEPILRGGIDTITSFAVGSTNINSVNNLNNNETDRIVTNCQSGMIKIYKIEQKPSKKLVLLRQFKGSSRSSQSSLTSDDPAYHIDIDSSLGSKLFACSFVKSRSIKIFDFDGNCFFNTNHHSSLVVKLCFYPNLQQRSELYACFADGAIRMWNFVSTDFSKNKKKRLKKFETEKILKNHMSIVSDLKFDCLNQTMISCSHDKVVTLWDLKTFEIMNTFVLMQPLESIDFFLNTLNSKLHKNQNIDLDQKIILAGGASGSIRAYNLDKRKFVRKFKLRLNFSIQSNLENEEGIGEKRSLKKISEQHQRNQKFDSIGILQIFVLSNQNKIIVTTQDLNIFVYAFDSKTFFSKHIYQNASKKQSLICPNQGDCCCVNLKSVFVGFNGQINDLCLFRNTNLGNSEHYVALATNSCDLKILDSNLNRSVSAIYYGHTDIILSVKASLDGNYLVTSSKDRTIRIQDVMRKRCIAIGQGHTSSVTSIALDNHRNKRNKTCKFLLTASLDRTVKYQQQPELDEAEYERCIETPSVTLVFADSNSDMQKDENSKTRNFDCQELVSSRTKAVHNGDINQLSLSPSSKYFVTASQDKSIKVFKVSNFELKCTLIGHKRGVQCAKFSPVDKNLIASSSADKTVRIQSIKDLSCLKTFEGHTNSVVGLEFSSIDPFHRLVSYGSDGTIREQDIKKSTFELVNDSEKEEEQLSNNFATLLPDDDNFLDTKIHALSLSKCFDKNMKIDDKTLTDFLICGSSNSCLSIYQRFSEAYSQQLEHNKQAETTQQLMHVNNLKMRVQKDKSLKYSLESLNILLDLPQNFRQILESKIDSDGIDSLEEIFPFSKLSGENVQKLVKLIEMQCTNSKTVILAHCLLKILFQSYDQISKDLKKSENDDKLDSKNKLKASILNSISISSIDKILVQSERSLSRYDKLLQDSELIDYVSDVLRGNDNL